VAATLAAQVDGREGPSDLKKPQAKRKLWNAAPGIEVVAAAAQKRIKLAEMAMRM
jgi:hypothetical protein